MMPTPRIPIVVPAILAALAAASPLGANAHEAASGWTYPIDCCANQDCREVAPAAISEKPGGYLIKLNGEQIPYSDSRVKQSPDGRYHWCSAQGSDKTRTICLFVPPHSF